MLCVNAFVPSSLSQRMDSVSCSMQNAIWHVAYCSMQALASTFMNVCVPGAHILNEQAYFS